MNTTIIYRRRTIGETVKAVNWEDAWWRTFGFFMAGFWTYLAYVYVFAIGGVLGFFGAGLCLMFSAAGIAIMFGGLDF